MNENEQYRLVGRSKKELRAKDDFYPTPDWVGKILVKYFPIKGSIWECACGNGALAKVLQQAGYSVVATDLIWRGYGSSGVDLSYEFMEHGFHLALASLALLLPIRYLAGLKRAEFYKIKPPHKIIIIPKKIDFLNSGNPVMEFAWFVWDKTKSGPTQVIWADL